MSATSAQAEARPMLPAGSRSAIARSHHHQPTARTSTLAWSIALLCLIALQMYAIAMYRHPTPTAAPCTPHRASSSTPSTTLALIQSAVAKAKAKRGDSSSGDEASLADSQAALDSLSLLNRYFRTRKHRLDLLLEGNATELTIDDEFEAISKLAEQSSADHDHEHDGLAVVGTHEHHAADKHDEAYLRSQTDLYHSQMWLNFSSAWSADVLHPDRFHRLEAAEQKRVTACLNMVKDHGVQVQLTWGTLSPVGQQRFNDLKCPDVISLKVTAEYIQANPEFYDRVWAVPTERPRVKPEKGMEDKVIAIIVAMTTRSLTINNFATDLALFRDLFPTFTATADVGFEYWFYLGYDFGDPWLDREVNQAAIHEWWDAHVAAPLRTRGIVAKLLSSGWTNRFAKPGPAFNHFTGLAYADGATWIYRINDDQRFNSPWAKAFVDELTAMGPPYGVVGPAHHQGATHILVVDFVHRTHHEIFPTHYPPSLMAWWMDNWISQIYGRKRTKRVQSAKIEHLVGSHGTRYAGFWEVGQFLHGEIVRGRAMFEAYLAHTPGLSSVLEEYRADDFNYATRR